MLKRNIKKYFDGHYSWAFDGLPHDIKYLTRMVRIHRSQMTLPAPLRG